MHLRITSNRLIGRNEGELPGNGLRDEEAVKRITMPRRQFLKRRNVLQSDRQDAGLQVSSRLPEPAGRVGNTELWLEGNLPGGDYASNRFFIWVEQEIANPGGKPIGFPGGPQDDTGVEERGHSPFRKASASSSVIARRAESGTDPLSQPSRR